MDLCKISFVYLKASLKVIFQQAQDSSVFSWRHSSAFWEKSSVAFVHSLRDAVKKSVENSILGYDPHVMFSNTPIFFKKGKV